MRLADMLRALAEGATEAPWHLRQANKNGLCWVADAPDGVPHTKIIIGRGSLYGGVPDYELIVALRNALPEILNALDEHDASRDAIAEANNSLYGSQNFFLSTNGGDPDKYHLSRPIEELKARGNREWRRAEESQREHDALTARVAELEAGLKVFARIADHEARAADGASVFVNVNRCRDAKLLLTPPIDEGAGK